MKTKNKLILTLLTLVFSLSGTSQEVKVFQTFEEFEPFLQQKNDTIYVVNFWATWCKPCVEEMPEFMKVNEKFREQKFKMLLVSLDFDSQLESKVKPFINKNNIEAEVVLLTDSKQHQWIDKVNENWSGSIPATVIYNKDYYSFHEEKLNFENLNEIITKNIKQ